MLYWYSTMVSLRSIKPRLLTNGLWIKSFTLYFQHVTFLIKQYTLFGGQPAASKMGQEVAPHTLDGQPHATQRIQWHNLSLSVISTRETADE